MNNDTSFTCYTYASPHGPFCIQASSRGITAVSFGNQKLSGKETATALMNEAASQLQEYLAGKRKEFSLALDMHGSSFQKLVWTEVCTIPYGQILSSSDIANRIGRPGSYRSVGTAIKRCSLAPFVPIHRIENPQATGARAKLYSGFISLEQRMMQS